MEYRPSELAEEIGCDLSTVYQSFIPAGCPHRRDGTGHYWIVGTEFQDWAKRIMKRARRQMKAGEAFCFTCDRPVPMKNPVTRPINRVLQMTTGKCSHWLAVVKSWDDMVRKSLPDTTLWYASLTTDGTGFTGSRRMAKRRPYQAARRFQVLCERAGVPALSPHKIRHGYAVHTLGLCRTVDQLKAVSQNLMHSSLTVTDSIYSVFGDNDMKARITTLGSHDSASASPDLVKQSAQALTEIGVLAR